MGAAAGFACARGGTRGCTAREVPLEVAGNDNA